MLHPKIAEELRELYRTMEADGKLLTRSQLDSYYQAFRKRFGPERLGNLDGVELLHTMHGNASHDSMVYWLEFKNDDEFPSTRFGSIAGGSALKFGLYLSNRTQAWTIGSPQNQVGISEQEAVRIARKHRDQLLEGCELLAQLPENGSENDYSHLQAEMTDLVPDVENSAWGHKYFSLIFPDKLDDFHSPYYQAFHLLKLLIHPPSENRRYLAACHYVAVACETELPLNTLATVLNSLHGRTPYHFWRVGTSDGKEPRNQWQMMRDNSVVAIGWPNLGDLTPELHTDLKADIRAGLELPPYSKSSSVLSNSTRQILLFVEIMQQGDIVIASDGMTILGVGRIKSGYTYNPDFHFSHQRQVEWLSFEEWQLPSAREGLLTTICDLRQYDNQFALEEHIFGRTSPPRPPDAPTSNPEYVALSPLEGVPARIEAVLERKGQVILYGPPGTGKTYWAEIAASELAARSAFGKAFDALTPEERTVVSGDNTNAGLARWCCFHPAYGYEDFLEGYRPHAQEGQMLFELRNGIFKTLCEDAQANPNHNFYLLVDEINRGDIPRIFGELLTILESNKRGKFVVLPLSKTPFAVPKNVYVIGTMNTADRSIALLDAALRRRFGFIELMPDSSTLGRTFIEEIPLADWLDALNARICEHIGRDARNLQIGHSYFLENGLPIRDFAHLSRVLREDIVPLLEEYCYEDYAALEKILGSSLVDGKRQQIREELFEPARQDELIVALLAPCPEIMATPQAIMMEAEAQNEALELDNEAEDDIEAMDGSQ